MDRIVHRLSRTRYGSLLIAKRRFFVTLAIICLILISLKLTENVDDSKWPRRPGYSQLRSSNGTLLNGTFIPNSPLIRIGDGYKRPGFELPLASGIPLRIMAVGASTTRGEKSHDNNGFRRYLRDHLVGIGNKVNYIGSDRVGNMTDNDVEAWPGTRLDTIWENVEKHVPSTRPNIFLSNVGSNDCYQHWEIPDFYKRYYGFINYMLNASPRSTVIMGTLLPTTETERFNGSADVKNVNHQIRNLFKILQKEGKPVVLAEMQGTTGIQEDNLGPDGMHPTDAGYEMMGRIILQAIIEADAKGFIRPAEPVPGLAQDGDLERRDEAHEKWRSQQTKLEQDLRINEDQELRAMSEGLDKYMKEMDAKKAQNMQLRGHTNMARAIVLE